MRRIILSAIAALATMSAIAQVQLTPLFSDNMVFQQNCQAPVWGKAVPGAEVKVIPSWNNKVYTAVADAEGRWQVSIPTPKGSFKKYTLTISDGEPVVLRNVAVGEVWLASGQSNMEMSFDRLSTRLVNQDGILNADKYADVRILNVSRATGMVERDFFSAEFGKWVESSPETIRNFSAAGWYFGRKLMDELGVPVGFSSEKVADVSKMCYLCKRKIINA